MRRSSCQRARRRRRSRFRRRARASRRPPPGPRRAMGSNRLRCLCATLYYYYSPLIQKPLVMALHVSRWRRGPVRSSRRCCTGRWRSPPGTPDPRSAPPTPRTRLRARAPRQRPILTSVTKFPRFLFSFRNVFPFQATGSGPPRECRLTFHTSFDEMFLQTGAKVEAQASSTTI